MRIILFGIGTIGVAVKATLQAGGHEVRTVSRAPGADLLEYLTDAKSLRALFERAGAFDAVACAAGDVFPAPLEQATDEQWAKSFASKAMGQSSLARPPFPGDRPLRPRAHVRPSFSRPETDASGARSEPARA
jgi:nucleoside-diphosphate-sugar epimerase